MNNYQAVALLKVETNWLIQFLGLGGLAIALPFFIHQQLVTGPIINAILVLSIFLLGLRGAVVIALLPSLMALSSGLLPAVLSPTVPFIMLSNIILILTIEGFYRLNKKEGGYWWGLLMGAGLKALFLFLSTGLIAKLLINQQLMTAVIKMMGWAQLATALAGGLLAWLVLKSLKYFK